MQDELKTLFPEVEVTLKSGEVVTVYPLKFGQLAKAAGLMTNVVGSAIVGYNDLLADPNSTASAIGRALIESGEDLYNLLALGLKRDRAWFDELDMDDGIKLTTTFVEVNSDFFVKQALPLVLKSLGKLKKTASQD